MNRAEPTQPVHGSGPAQPQLTPRDDSRLRAARFDRPDHIPMTFHINDACWHHYPQEQLCRLMVDYPALFDFAEPPTLPHTPNYLPNARADRPFVDPWGCKWQTTDDGIIGTVVEHPLAEWAGFERFAPPDPSQSDGMGDYLGSSVRSSSTGRRMKMAGLRHGHTFMQLIDLRGYENLMFDMADDEPRLWRLIEMVEQFNLALVGQGLAGGAQWVNYPEDLGMQTGPMIDPHHFRKYIQPTYKRLMAPAKKAGAVIHMHCDGHLHAVIDDVIDCGVEVINLQDNVNGMEWIAERVKGRICIDLDIDRQGVTVSGTPQQIDDLVRREVELLGGREGGLMMIYGLYPGVPIENARAVAEAMQRYAGYYAG